MFEKDLMLGTAQRSEKYLNTVLDKLVKAIGRPAATFAELEADELFEAVKLLVEERDELWRQKEEAIRDRDFYRNIITKLVDSATKISP